MNTEKMTIHKALSELKILDARINSAIAGADYCFANKHSNTKVRGKELSEVKERMKSDFQSLTTLINRQNAIKRAISLSNSETEVEIDGKKYRVAEAINMKNCGINYYVSLRNEMNKQYADSIRLIERANGDDLERKANDYVIGLYGSKEKASSTEAEATRKAYIEANSYDLVDPLQIKERIAKLNQFIDNFTSEVDSALSVSNAITVIEFSYEVE